MAEDAELQARMTTELHTIGDNMTAIMAEIEQTKFTAQEVADAIQSIGPALHEAWLATIGNEMLWQARIDGPVYRRAFLFGRFRWYRRVRVWHLRRSLR